LGLAYYKRILRAFACLSQLEQASQLVHEGSPGPTLFGTYKRKHWHYCFIYLCSTDYFAPVFLR